MPADILAHGDQRAVGPRPAGGVGRAVHAIDALLERQGRHRPLDGRARHRRRGADDGHGPHRRIDAVDPAQAAARAAGQAAPLLLQPHHALGGDVERTSMPRSTGSTSMS